jgi:hypothetical protein
VSIAVASHRIVGSEVGRRNIPGNGALRLGRSRRRKLSGWGLVFAPVILLAGGIAAVAMWPFR